MIKGLNDVIFIGDSNQGNPLIKQIKVQAVW